VIIFFVTFAFICYLRSAFCRREIVDLGVFCKVNEVQLHLDRSATVRIIRDYCDMRRFQGEKSSSSSNTNPASVAGRKSLEEPASSGLLAVRAQSRREQILNSFMNQVQSQTLAQRMSGSLEKQEGLRDSVPGMQDSSSKSPSQLPNPKPILKAGKECPSEELFTIEIGAEAFESANLKRKEG
jgi:hypothetical protein